MTTNNIVSRLPVTLCTALVLAGLVAPANAQQAGADALDEIVVTATRTATSVRDVARSVSVVDKARIQVGTQQLGLDEALAGVPGLYMQNRYNFAQDLRISLRGFGARSSFGIRGIRIIVDGIPETLPDGQAGVDSIDLGSAGSIEVLRGPASSLFGNASGGVIAVTTELGSEAPFVEGRIAGGDYGYRQLQLKSAGVLGGADYLVNLARTVIDGYRDHSDTRGSLFNSKFSLPIGGSDRLVVGLNLTDQPEADDPGGINAAQASSDPTSARDQNVQFDAGESLEQQRLGIVYERERPAGLLTLRNHYVWREFANRLPFTAGGAVDIDRFFYGLGAQYSLAGASDAMTLTFGVDYDKQDDHRRRFDNNDGDLGPMVFDQDEVVDSLGAFAQGQFRLNDAWNFNAGLRWDEIRYDVSDRYLADGDDSGRLDFDRLSPSLALSRALRDGVVFVSYSSSFETPTTTELANPDASGGFNPGLDPQSADNFEIGYKRSVDDLYLELVAFTIDLEDELIPFELPQFPGRTFYSNAGSSTRDGIEAAVAWKHHSGLRLDASYTWSDFEFDDFVDDDGTDFGGSRLPGLPEHFAYAGLSWHSDNGFQGTIEATYSGRLYANNANTARVSSYTVANLRVAREFSTGRWNIRPYAGINNLFDERYSNNIRINAFGGRYFEPAPERHYYAGVVVNFSGPAQAQ